MLSMDMITKPEASVLTDMARAGNEYVTAALELYQSGLLWYDTVLLWWRIWVLDGHRVQSSQVQCSEVQQSWEKK